MSTKNLSQLAQVIESAKDSNKNRGKGRGRSNSRSQVENAIVLETGTNEDLVNSKVGMTPETINRVNQENESAKESEKENKVSDPFRTSVADSFKNLCSESVELADLRAKVAAKESELLVAALESCIPSLYQGVATAEEINSFIEFGRTFTDGWRLDCCTRLGDGIKSVRSESVTTKNSEGKDVTRYAYAVSVDSDKFYPVTIVGRFRSFVDVARVAGLPCYAPFAKADAQNKAKETANNAISKAISAGVDYSELIAALPADLLEKIRNGK